MMRKYLWLVALCLGVLVAAGPSRAQNSMEALYKAAKAEGRVTIWSPMDPEEVSMLTTEFKKEFPGVEVKHFEIRPDDYAPRAVAEARQGIVSFDIATGRLVGLSPLLDRNLIQTYNDWTKIFGGLNSASVSKDGRLLTIYSLVYPVAYNTQLLKPEEVPRSWDDLLAPKWKEKIIVEPRANAFGYLGLKWSEEKVVNYLKKLKAQDPIFVKGGTGTAQQLVAGVGPLAIGAYAHKILQMKAQGAPIDWAKKVSPVGSTDNVVFVMKGAPHPNAAKLLAGWLASDKSQRLLNTKLYRGAISPGSSYAAVREFEKNNVEVLRETPENYKRAREINKAAVKTLGVLR